MNTVASMATQGLRVFELCKLHHEWQIFLWGHRNYWSRCVHKIMYNITSGLMSVQTLHTHTQVSVNIHYFLTIERLWGRVILIRYRRHVDSLLDVSTPPRVNHRSQHGSNSENRLWAVQFDTWTSPVDFCELKPLFSVQKGPFLAPLKA